MTGPERGATWWHQAAAGGGAMLDFCCYGAMVARWYIGEPAVAAVGMRANLDSPWGDADDNGAILVRFPQALALLEGSWTTWDHGVPGGPILYGTTGTLVVESRDGKEVVRLERGGGQTTLYEGEPLPAGRRNLAEEFIHHRETGEPLHPTLEMEFNLEAMAILDAGVRSAASGKLEMVDSPIWQIG
jgi:predicted dehydrogenase